MATKIDFYERYATKHLVIDEDAQGLFCEVCSECHAQTHYTVRVDESGMVPVATSCNCPATKPCKHMRIVNSFYARIYKSNVAKAEAKQEAEAAIAEVEKIINSESNESTTIQPIRKSAKVTDIGLKGNLNVGKAFSLMR